MKIELGRTYKDKITGFSGVATGYVEYITGCNQALIAPRSDGGKIESAWFDVQRLKLDEDIPKVELDNGSTPGCDTAAPIR